MPQVLKKRSRFGNAGFFPLRLSLAFFVRQQTEKSPAALSHHPCIAQWKWHQIYDLDGQNISFPKQG